MQDMEYIKIPLVGKYGRGLFTLVDGDYDGEWLSSYQWHLNPKSGYAYAKIDGILVTLHKLICKVPKGMVVDHINRDKLNNRSCNLRPASYCLSANNRSYTPRARGVSKTALRGIYRRDYKNARYDAKFRHEYLGYFDNIKDAAEAYNRAALSYYGDKAILNVI